MHRGPTDVIDDVEEEKCKICKKNLMFEEKYECSCGTQFCFPDFDNYCIGMDCYYYCSRCFPSEIKKKEHRKNLKCIATSSEEGLYKRSLYQYNLECIKKVEETIKAKEGELIPLDYLREGFRINSVDRDLTNWPYGFDELDFEVTLKFRCKK